jgi:hypothetical protein
MYRHGVTRIESQISTQKFRVEVYFEVPQLVAAIYLFGDPWL